MISNPPPEHPPRGDTPQRENRRLETMAGPSDHRMTSFASLSGGETDDSAVSKNPSSSEVVEQSVAEKAREKKLRDDPMADVLGPFFVDCRNCGKRIKLSSKSSYDTFHWRTHRERCLKKQRAQKQRARTQKSSPVPSRHSSLGALERPRSPAATPPNREPLSEPPRTTPRSRDKVSSFIPTTSTSELPIRPASDFEEYLRLSHRRQVRPMPPGPSGHWQDWSWSQLVPPKFVTDAPAGDGEPNTHQKPPNTQLYDDVMDASSILSRSA